MMVMMMTAGGIGTILRIERCDDMRHMSAELLHHIRDDVICTNADMPIEQLHGQMAIAEMPGDAHQLVAVMRMNIEQFLAARRHPHPASILKVQAITIAKAHGLRHIEQDFGASFGC